MKPRDRCVAALFHKPPLYHYGYDSHDYAQGIV